jgi:hypothetical protein
MYEEVNSKVGTTHQNISEEHNQGVGRRRENLEIHSQMRKLRALKNEMTS